MEDTLLVIPHLLSWLPIFWPQIALALKSKCSISQIALTDSYCESKNKNRKAKERDSFLISPAPGCSSVLPWLLFLASGVWALLTFMTLFNNYLSSSVMSLQKSACCPVRCCSISSKCSWKLWHTIFIISISWTVHWEQLERAEKEVLSDSQ